MKDWSCPSSR